MKSRPKKQQSHTTTMPPTLSTTNTQDAVANLERRLEQLDVIPTAPAAEEEESSTIFPVAQMTTTTATPTPMGSTTAATATPTTSMSGLRDPYELEGTLLPTPITAIPTNSSDYNEQVARGYAAAVAAIPVQAFAYNEESTSATSTAQQQQQQQQQQQPISATELEIKQQYILDDTSKERVVHGAVIEQGVPSSSAALSAPLIPNAGIDDELERHVIESVTLAEGRRRGIIESEIEKDSIKRENRQSYAKEYYERASIKVARKVALQRDREGLQIKQDKYTLYRKEAPQHKDSTTRKDSDESSYFPKEYKGGYEVKEYDTKEYAFESDYETKEYKSLYDE